MTASQGFCWTYAMVVMDSFVRVLLYKSIYCQSNLNLFIVRHYTIQERYFEWLKLREDCSSWTQILICLISIVCLLLRLENKDGWKYTNKRLSPYSVSLQIKLTSCGGSYSLRDIAIVLQFDWYVWRINERVREI